MEQAQAYKLSILGERLKAKGLDLAEDMLMMVADETLDFIGESAVVSKNPYDDIIVVVMPTVKQKLKAEVIDRVDGKDEIQ